MYSSNTKIFPNGHYILTFQNKYLNISDYSLKQIHSMKKYPVQDKVFDLHIILWNL